MFDRASPAAYVLLVDLGLPSGSGVELIGHAALHLPACDVVVVSVFGDERSVLASIEAGATGYLLKDAHNTDLADQTLSLRADDKPDQPGGRAPVAASFRGGQPTGGAHGIRIGLAIVGAGTEGADLREAQLSQTAGPHQDRSCVRGPAHGLARALSMHFDRAGRIDLIRASLQPWRSLLGGGAALVLILAAAFSAFSPGRHLQARGQVLLLTWLFPLREAACGLVHTDRGAF